MKKLLAIVSSFALALGVSHAQAPSTARMGITPLSPQSLEVLDNSGVWVPVGTVNNHNFSVSKDLFTFGAKCDGSDDTAAIQAALSWLVSNNNQTLRIPSAICAYTSSISVAPTGVQNISIIGDGDASTLKYTGSVNSIPLITMGTPNFSGGCSIYQFLLQGVRFISSTLMTAGDAVELNDVCQGQILQTTFGQNLGGFNNNFYNGLHLNGGNSVKTSYFLAVANHAAYLVNGDNNYHFTDPILNHATISNSGIGIEIAGWVGGFFADDADILENGANVVVDTTQNATPNLQLKFGTTFHADVTNSSLYPSSSQIGLEVKDPGGSESYLFYNGSLASAGAQCFLLDANSGQGWVVIFQGGAVFNCHTGIGNGNIENANTSARTSIQLAGMHFDTGGNLGNPFIYNVVGANPIILGNVIFYGPNTVANYITGSWVGSYIDNVGSTIFSSNGNIRMNPAATYAVVLGPGGTSSNVALWVKDGSVIPGAANGSVGGGNYDIGSGSFQFTNAYFSGTVNVGTLNSANYTSSASEIHTSNGNIRMNPAATYAVVLGPGGTSSNVALWVKDGSVIPGAADGSTGGGVYDIGQPSFPFRNAYFNGTINATGFIASGTAGVSCSGVPTASFAVSNGIVTHC